MGSRIESKKNYSGSSLICVNFKNVCRAYVLCDSMTSESWVNASGIRRRDLSSNPEKNSERKRFSSSFHASKLIRNNVRFSTRISNGKSSGSGAEASPPSRTPRQDMTQVVGPAESKNCLPTRPKTTGNGNDVKCPLPIRSEVTGKVRPTLCGGWRGWCAVRQGVKQK